MKKLNKKIVVLLIVAFAVQLFFLNQSTYASSEKVAFSRVKYTEEFKKWMNLSEEEKEVVQMPQMYEILTSNIKSKNPLYKLRTVRANRSPHFSLKDIIPENVVVKDQKNTNLCWTFASLSSLETNLALSNYKSRINLSKVYDFSERHMAYATTREFKNNVENKMGYNKDIKYGRK